MNPWQFAQQIKHQLQVVRWSSGDRALVFGRNGVAVFAGEPSESQIPNAFPWALVGIAGGDFDEDDPEIVYQRFDILIGAEVAGDPLGEFALIGGAAANLGRSAGRGASELAERVRAAVQDLNGSDGAKILLSGTETGTPAVMGQGRHLVLERMTVEAVCHSRVEYAAPQNLRWVNGTWQWAGEHCSRRHDFLQFRLLRKAGAEQSKDASDGVVLYTGTAPEWEGVQANGWTYTVFADYCSRGNGTIEGTSPPDVGAWRVV